MEYTHNEYCYIFSPSVLVIFTLVLMCRNSRYIILVDVIQVLMCFDDYSSAALRHEV